MGLAWYEFHNCEFPVLLSLQAVLHVKEFFSAIGSDMTKPVMFLMSPYGWLSPAL